MRARYYAPRWGRFVSVDPIGALGGPNVYAFTGNRPGDLWDPLGLCPYGNPSAKGFGPCPPKPCATPFIPLADSPFAHWLLTSDNWLTNFVQTDENLEAAQNGFALLGMTAGAMATGGLTFDAGVALGWGTVGAGRRRLGGLSDALTRAEPLSGRAPPARSAARRIGVGTATGSAFGWAAGPAPAMRQLELPFERMMRRVLAREGELLADTGGTLRLPPGAGGGAVPRGGMYVLRDPATGQVMRTGRSGDLAQRAAQHGRDPALRDLTFEPVHRTDVYAEQRGPSSCFTKRTSRR
jgi:hypothetical protein